jgi:type II secretory ATPase GspE/PulE/Tfp pilus assembly ATPase PilB-like protein
LHYLNDGTRKINTIEDPIEYAMYGVRQSAINPNFHLDFPELLRSILRQSPDVIMVGEIRDPVTAETAVRAANSGQLVLATLHAPIAAGAIDSMLALGVHPHFLGTGLLGILTQRLVRTLCPECRVAVDISESPHTFDDVKRWLPPDQDHAIYAAPGCEHCHQDGYTDRTGVFEVLRASREIRRLVAEGRTAREIRATAIAEGMLDMRRSALLKVAQGITSTEEILRVIPTEHVTPED